MEETGFRNGHSSNFIDAAAEAGDINCLLSICFRRLEPGRGLTGAKSLLMRAWSDGGTGGGPCRAGMHVPGIHGAQESDIKQ